MHENENIKFDCSRGCTVSHTDDGQPAIEYRHGCCKLETYNWLAGVNQEQYESYFEVRFKNTRKGFYI